MALIVGFELLKFILRLSMLVLRLLQTAGKLFDLPFVALCARLVLFDCALLQEKLSHACIEVTIMNTSLNHFEDLGEGIRILVNGTGEKLTIAQLTGI